MSENNLTVAFLSNTGHIATKLSSSSDESATVDSPASGSTESESTLSSFVRIADNSNFVWGDVNSETFSSLLDQVYNEIVHWRRNIFPLPTGRGGKCLFVSSLVCLMLTIQVPVLRELH